MMVIALTHRLPKNVGEEFWDEGCHVIDFVGEVISEEFEDSRYDNIDDYYQATIEEDQTYFAKELLVEPRWIQFYESFGDHAVGGDPKNTYLVHGIRTSRELEFLRNELEDEIIIITEQQDEDEFYKFADLSISFQSSEHSQRILRGIVNEFVIK